MAELTSEMEVSNNVEYVGIREISVEQKEKLDMIAEEYQEKISHSLKNDFRLQVHIKTYRNKELKPGEEPKRVKYSIHVKVLCAGKDFASTNHNDWDFVTALRKSFKSVLSEIRTFYKE
ncbi:hypothetical protein ACFL0W_01425 [Nanoarchaeota archaeon]